MAIRQPLGYEKPTPLTSAKALTVPAGATRALLQVEDQKVRWRDDGTDPTNAIGIVIGAGDEFLYEGDLSAIKFIQETATAELNVAYFA
jgi:hypothetical protein